MYIQFRVVKQHQGLFIHSLMTPDIKFVAKNNLTDAPHRVIHAFFIPV